MTSRYLIVKNSKIRYSVALVAIVLICSYIFVCYGHKYNRGYVILPVTFLLIAYIFLLDIWSDWLKINKLHWLGRRIGFFLIIAVTGSLLVNLKDIYERSQLQKYGLLVDGKITDAESVDGSRTGYFFSAGVEYYVNKKLYHQRAFSSSYIYKYGDNVKILCSSHDPELIKIISRKSGLDIKY